MKRENIEIRMHDARLRKIRIALPEDNQPGEKYPVLYLFDGQNIFDKKDSFAGVTWDVENAVEKLVREKIIKPLIIVAIDNAGENRLDEYGPWPFKDEIYSSEGKGNEFAAFLVEELIPQVEEKYPISRNREDRFLAGSSMGGLITAYIGAKYPEIFSSLGVFSLASWVSEKPFLKMLNEEGDFKDMRFFIQVGTEESRDEKTGKVDIENSQIYVDNTLNYLRALLERGADYSRISLTIAVGKTHHEEVWASFMPQFLKWLHDK
ncbi:alpha/beta hydrolase [Proteiniclasticum sp. C24MP]|uniref:alpha/beta hydrolase n=1 Tax=Proteiniclasticum sp. C24MP TaxID=3374101 RepID=UPI0037545F2D